MPKIEDGEKVNRSSKGKVRKEGRGEGVEVEVMRARGLRCFRGSRVARNLHFSLLSFRFHRSPLPSRMDLLEPESFRTARKHSASRESFRSYSHGSVCICVRVYVYKYRCCKDSLVISASLSFLYFYFRFSICLARKGQYEPFIRQISILRVYIKGTKINLSIIVNLLKTRRNQCIISLNFSL